MTATELNNADKRKKLKPLFAQFNVKPGKDFELLYKVAEKYCQGLLADHQSLVKKPTGRPKKYKDTLVQTLFPKVRHYMRVYNLNEDEAVKKLYDDGLIFRDLDENERKSKLVDENNEHKSKEALEQNNLEYKNEPLDIYVAHRSQQTHAVNWDKIIHTNKTDLTQQHGKPGKIRQRVTLTTIHRRYYAEKEEIVKQRVDSIMDTWEKHGMLGLTIGLWLYAGYGCLDINFGKLPDADIEQFLNSEELKSRCAEQIENTKHYVGGLAGDFPSTVSK